MLAVEHEKRCTVKSSKQELLPVFIEKCRTNNILYS